jgi:hypothetical protein
MAGTGPAMTKASSGALKQKPRRETDLGFTRDLQLKLLKPAVAGLGGFEF